MKKMSRIEEARKAKGWERPDLAEAVGLSAETIARYERGDRSPKVEELKKIATALGVSAAYLMDEPNEKPPVTLSNGNKILSMDSLTWIPVISPEVKVSAGAGNCCEEVIWEKIDEFPLFDGKIAALYSDNGLLSIYVEGDSMEPQIHDGDLVIFNKIGEWVPGNIVVICLDGRLMVKGILKGPEGEIRLRSLNRNYEDIVIGKGSFFLVYGRVIKIVRQWDPKPVL